MTQFTILQSDAYYALAKFLVTVKNDAVLIMKVRQYEYS